MTTTNNQTATEKRLQATKMRRTKAENIVLAALTCAINRGLELEDHEVIWRGDREEYISSVLNNWLYDEDGEIAVDRLVTLIIH